MIYSPADDSCLLKNIIKNYVKDKMVLDMGTGSGVLAIEALKQKAKSVLACDINPESIKHVSSLGINTIQSNLFASIKDKFDVILFNPPYLPKDKNEDKESAVVTTGGKKGDEIILKFLKQSKKHLNKEGVILLLVSSLTPEERILKLFKKLNYLAKEVAKEKIFFESLHVLEIRKNE